jgi:hypothetical protein
MSWSLKETTLLLIGCIRGFTASYLASLDLYQDTRDGCLGQIFGGIKQYRKHNVDTFQRRLADDRHTSDKGCQAYARTYPRIIGHFPEVREADDSVLKGR